MLLATSSTLADNNSITLESQLVSTTPLTLEDAVAFAVRNNLEIQSAYLQRIAQKLDLYVAEGKFFPNFTLTSGITNNRINGSKVSNKDLQTNVALNLPTGTKLQVTTSNGLSTGSANSSSKSITITQPLLKNAGLDVNLSSVRVARLDEKINRQNLKSSLEQTIYQVVLAYRELLRAQDQKKVAEDSLTRSKEIYSVNKALISAGRMAAVDLLQTEADVTNREVALQETENQVEAARLALLSLLSLESKVQILAAQSREIKLKSIDLAYALNTALSFQSDYKIALLQIEKSKINLEYAKNQKLWDLSLVAGRSESRINFGSAIDGSLAYGNQDSNQKNISSYAGLQLTIQFGDRTIEQSVVHASVDLKENNLRLLAIRQLLEQQIRDAVRNAQIRWRQLELSRKACQLSSLKLTAEREKLQVGRSSNFQVLSFESDLRNAESMRVNSEIAYLNAQTNLELKTGLLLESMSIPLADREYAENEF